MHDEVVEFLQLRLVIPDLFHRITQSDNAKSRFVKKEE